ncbi:PREDICTED: KAT8 regulatory NSL complex subunit 1-like [Priapulus caudatus]|uniref:KAT8 regulatory NSL complex subunit 1-like n=1 Tax=Priapulus caudatus TaxID=37621 RepID=A0ABM1DQN6_PRICU|nr:PREDICTED: KAT8 regulatory NSL complex subunit 1-like [Priapulus caudatus]
MCSRWPLRLSRPFAMAPALSDAIRQSVHSGFRLPPSPPPSESSPETDRERDCESPTASERAVSPVQAQKAQILVRPHNGYSQLKEANIPALLRKLAATNNNFGIVNTMDVDQKTGGNRIQKATCNLRGSNTNGNPKLDMTGQRNSSSSSPIASSILAENRTTVQQPEAVSPTQLDESAMDTDDQSELTLLKSLVCDRLADAGKRQVYLERRAERLLQRLRRLQTMQTNTHVREQLVAFVQHQRKNLQSCVRSTTRTCSAPNSSDFHAELLQSEDVKNLSTAALVNLVRKLESAHGSQRQRLYSSRGAHSEDQVTVALGDDLCDEISCVSSSLAANLGHLERVLDSEATDSSSGGESCDEEEFDTCETQHHSVYRRASWKWSVDRAAIASRWTWLQAQVSDLEYRIRQQNDIYKQIRANKGPVVLGDQKMDAVMARARIVNRTARRLSPLETKISNMERYVEAHPNELSPLHSSDSSRAAARRDGFVQKPVNGYIDDDSRTGQQQAAGGTALAPRVSQSSANSVAVTSTTGGLPEAAAPGTPAVAPGQDDVTACAARTRPLRSYRKRKLLRAAGIHYINRKAARLSTVKCGCAAPITSCVMCGGRFNNVQTLDPDTMSLPERIGLLDPSHHQVLSFCQEVPLQHHFESLLKTGDWQTKASPKQTLGPSSSSSSSSTTYKKRRLKNHAEQRIKRLKLKNAAAFLLSNAKLRNKLVENNGKRGRLQTLSLPSTAAAALKNSGRNSRLCKSELRESRKQRKAARLALAAMKKQEKQRAMCFPNDAYGNAMMSPSPPGSAMLSDVVAGHSHGKLEGGKDLLRRPFRKSENAFDINNIVIPESMAASARIMKLQYKEIITPKWRVVEDEVPPVPLPKARKMSTGSNGLVNHVGSGDAGDDEPDIIHHDDAAVAVRRNSGSFVRRESLRTSLCEDGSESGSGGSALCVDTSLYTYPTVAPYDARQFPLSDAEVLEIEKEPPTPTQQPAAVTDFKCAAVEPVRLWDGGTPRVSRPTSPSPQSSDYGDDDDDPDDPEWTVAAREARNSGRIVLKLSKR